ncbi:hypothetical protein Taro_056674, partial [Colocasia esculenta]|nr:hypothetical protein [Colocasia esculenta]
MGFRPLGNISPMGELPCFRNLRLCNACRVQLPIPAPPTPTQPMPEGSSRPLGPRNEEEVRPSEPNGVEESRPSGPIEEEVIQPPGSLVEESGPSLDKSGLGGLVVEESGPAGPVMEASGPSGPMESEAELQLLLLHLLHPLHLQPLPPSNNPFQTHLLTCTISYYLLFFSYFLLLPFLRHLQHHLLQLDPHHLHANFGTSSSYKMSLGKDEYAKFLEAQRQLHIQRMAPVMGPSYTIA